MQCFSYMFWCISRHLEGIIMWSLLKNILVEETWYRYVINKMCAFSSYKWRDGTTYSFHIFVSVEKQVTKNCLLLSLHHCCFIKFAIVVQFSFMFFLFFLIYSWQYCCCILMTAWVSCMVFISRCMVLRMNHDHGLPLSFQLFTDHVGIWTLYTSSSSIIIK